MKAASLDRLLGLLVIAQLATGLLTLRTGTPAGAPLFAVHGLLGGSLAAAIALKLRRSAPVAIRARRWGRLTLGLLVALLASAALGGGFAWVASGRLLSIGPWTVLTLHVWAALALAAALAVHLMPRRWRLLRIRPPSHWRRTHGGHDLSRRSLLALAGLGVVGILGWAAANLADATLGGTRRFTGSRALPPGGVPPVTTFYGEPTPTIDLASWRLKVRGRVRHPMTLTTAELARHATQTREATLDCTSGWAMTTSWSGVPTASLLAAAEPLPGARWVIVTAATGWSARIPLEEAGATLLATRVGGETLPPANGAPCRLVAPQRRGLDWVKWVTEIQVV